MKQLPFIFVNFKFVSLLVLIKDTKTGPLQFQSRNFLITLIYLYVLNNKTNRNALTSSLEF